MALPPTASQKDVIEDKLAEAELEIRKIRQEVAGSTTGAGARIDTAITAAKAALDAANAQIDAA